MSHDRIGVGFTYPVWQMWHCELRQAGSTSSSSAQWSNSWSNCGRLKTVADWIRASGPERRRAEECLSAAALLTTLTSIAGSACCSLRGPPPPWCSTDSSPAETKPCAPGLRSPGKSATSGSCLRNGGIHRGRSSKQEKSCCKIRK